MTRISLNSFSEQALSAEGLYSVLANAARKLFRVYGFNS
jgi:hypothetical protein